MDRRWGILAVIVVAQTCNSSLAQGLPTLFAFLQEDFQLSRAQVGLFLSAIQGGTVASFILGGWAADAIGVRRILPLAQVAIGLVAVGFSQAPSFEAGMGILLLAGFGLGVANPGMTIAVLQWFPARGRATAMGIKQTGVPIAGIASAAVLPSVALAYGWRAGILALGVAVLAAAVLSRLLYRDPPAARPVGAIRRPTWGQIAYLARQRDLLLIGAFAAVLIADQFAITGYLILYLRDHLGVAVVIGGLMLAVAFAGGLCGRIAWGLFSDTTLRGRRVPALGLAGGLAALLLLGLAFVPETTPVWLLAALAFGLGFTAMGWHALRQTLVPELVPRAVAGLALGVNQTVAEAGPVLGPPIFGGMADLAGYRVAWLVMAALTAIVSIALVRGLHERVPGATAGVVEKQLAAGDLGERRVGR